MKNGELKRAMEDMLAFIRWAQANGAESLIAPTIGHDLDGLLHDTSGCFSPRSFGYAEKGAAR